MIGLTLCLTPGEEFYNEVRVEEQLGSGGFGTVYRGVNTRTGQQVAMKVDEDGEKSHRLYSEYQVYRALAGTPGIPRVHYQGRIGKTNVLIIDLLGKNLDSTIHRQVSSAALATVARLADQMISLVEAVHSHGILHRDIKPKNFAMGYEANDPNIYLIDFGLVKRYIDRNGTHMKYRDGKNFTGTTSHASPNVMRGIEPTRRDDMISLGYTIVQALTGSLPWLGIKEDENGVKKKDLILQRKESTSPEQLCGSAPKFAQQPNYSYLRKLFQGLIFRCGFTPADTLNFKPTQCNVDRAQVRRRLQLRERRPPSYFTW